MDMTREQAKQLLPIITAFAEGKVIEYRHKNMPVTVSRWTKHQDEFDFNVDTYIYRVKPEPKELWFIYTGAILNDPIWFNNKEEADAYVKENPLRRVLHMREVIDE